jgi:EmrB/QacA subfamily drug resistance transporter
MNEPFTVPLFLPRVTSEQSQPSRRRGAARRWPSVRPAVQRQGRTVVAKASKGTSRGSHGASRSVDTSVGGPGGDGFVAVTSAVSEAAGGPAPTKHREGRQTEGLRADRRAGGRAVWAIVITGMALFMASLDNLVVTSALPVIRVHLHAGLSGLEWTVNAYTLTFAVLLLSAAAIGERFGRRRIFVLGIAVFTAASAIAALAPNISVLVGARAIQGAGGAMIMPLSLTLLSAAVPPERRNAALGLWGAIGGMAVAIGPLVGGAVTSGWAWQYIFWLNVPIGLALIPLAWWKLAESRGASSRLDLVGVGLVIAGLFGIVLGLVRGNAHGWSSTSVVTSFAVGSVALLALLAWELRSSHPMLDIRLFRNRAFAAVNVTAMLFSFGMFGSIFFLSQFLQTVQGLSPLAAGIRVLPWTAMVMVLAPVVGNLAERFGGKPLVVSGLLLQATGLTWLALLTTPSTPYRDMVVPFAISGVGMTLFFVPLASLVLSSVPRDLEGVASGTNSAFRELGGVLGIAVLGAVFSAKGGYRSGTDYVGGMTPAVYVGAAVVLVGAFVALMVPGRRRQQAALAAAEVLSGGPAAVPAGPGRGSRSGRPPVPVVAPGGEVHTFPVPATMASAVTGEASRVGASCPGFPCPEEVRASA